MTITIRLDEEGEHALQAREEGNGNGRRFHTLTQAMRQAFPGVSATVRVEDETGTLLAEDQLREREEPEEYPWIVPPELQEEFDRIMAMPRVPGMAFGILKGKGNPDPSVRDLPWEEETAVAAERAAQAKDARWRESFRDDDPQ